MAAETAGGIVILAELCDPLLVGKTSAQSSSPVDDKSMVEDEENEDERDGDKDDDDDDVTVVENSLGELLVETSGNDEAESVTGTKP